MSEAQAALVRYRLGEAKEPLEEARLLARESRWRGALNRVYYAMFYATLALLAVRQLASPRHSGVIALFHREFVRPGLFAREWASYLDIAFYLRNRSDYQNFVTPDTEAERLSQQFLTQQNE